MQRQPSCVLTSSCAGVLHPSWNGSISVPNWHLGGRAVQPRAMSCPLQSCWECQESEGHGTLLQRYPPSCDQCKCPILPHHRYILIWCLKQMMTWHPGIIQNQTQINQLFLNGRIMQHFVFSSQSRSTKTHRQHKELLTRYLLRFSFIGSKNCTIHLGSNWWSDRIKISNDILNCQLNLRHAWVPLPHPWVLFGLHC